MDFESRTVVLCAAESSGVLFEYHVGYSYEPMMQIEYTHTDKRLMDNGLTHFGRYGQF